MTKKGQGKYKKKKIFNFLRDQICRSDLFLTQITNLHAYPDIHVYVPREAGIQIAYLSGRRNLTDSTAAGRGIKDSTRICRGNLSVVQLVIQCPEQRM